MAFCECSKNQFGRHKKKFGNILKKYLKILFSNPENFRSAPASMAKAVELGSNFPLFIFSSLLIFFVIDFGKNCKNEMSLYQEWWCQNLDKN